MGRGQAARRTQGGTCSPVVERRVNDRLPCGGMDRPLFEPEHAALREAWGSYLDREVAPRYDEWERARRIPRDVLRRIGELGFLSPATPERFGGAGSDDFRFNAMPTEEPA